MMRKLFTIAALLLLTLFKVDAQNYVYDFVSSKNAALVDIQGLHQAATCSRQTYTFEYWVKPRALYPNYIGASYNSTRVTMGTGGQLYAAKWGTQSNGAVENLVWQHFAYVYNGGLLTIYKNGIVMDQTGSLGTTKDNFGTNLNNSFRIGYWTTSASNQVNMQVDEFRFWGTARTAEEIHNNYYKDAVQLLQGGIPVGLSVCYDGAFTYDATLSTNSIYVADLSGNNNTGIIANPLVYSKSVQATDIIFGKYPSPNSYVSTNFGKIEIGFLGTDMKPNTNGKYLKINDASGNCLYSFDVKTATTNPYVYTIPTLGEGNSYYITLDNGAFVSDTYGNATTSISGTDWKITTAPIFSIDGDNTNFKMVTTSPTYRMKFGTKLSTTSAIHSGTLNVIEVSTGNVGVSIDLSTAISSIAATPYDMTLGSVTTLLYDKDYKVQLVNPQIVDVLGNVITTAGGWTFHTEPRDLIMTLNMSPSVTVPAPFSVTLNKPATVYYLYKDASETAPTLADLQSIGVAIPSAIITPTKPFASTVPLAFCIANVKRKLYACAVDAAGNLTTMSSAEFTPTSPTVSINAIIPSTYTASLSISADRAGSAYFMISELGTTLPYFTTSAALVTVAAANIANKSLVTAPLVLVMKKNTSYTIYTVYKDNAGNFSPTYATATFTTLGGEDIPKVSSVASKGYQNYATLSITATEISTAYCLFTNDITATAPAASTICNSQDASLQTFNIGVAYVPVVVNALNLTENKSYKVFVAVKNGAGVADVSASYSTFTTDATKPVATITNISTTTNTVTIKGTKAGTLYYLVLAPGEAIPTSANMVINSTYSTSTIKGSKTVAANAATSIVLTGLLPSTLYTVYVVEVDNSLNTSDIGVMSFTSKTSIVDKTADLEVNLYPNPASDVVTVSYVLTEATNVTIELYSINGQKVSAIESGLQNAGTHTAQFDIKGLNEGVYLYRLNTSKGSSTKVVVIKH